MMVDQKTCKHRWKTVRKGKEYVCRKCGKTSAGGGDISGTRSSIIQHPSGFTR